MHAPTAEDYARLTAELASRFEGALTPDEVAAAVAAARAEIEPVSRHPEFLTILVGKHAHDQLTLRARRASPEFTETKDLLFVCEHNSARSQMAAAFADQLAGPHVHVHSAGRHPSGFLNPLVERAMAEKGIELVHPYPRAATVDVLHAADVIIEIGTELPRVAGRHHVRWEIEDPHGESMDSVRRARDDVEVHVRALLGDLGLLPAADA